MEARFLLRPEKWQDIRFNELYLILKAYAVHLTSDQGVQFHSLGDGVRIGDCGNSL